MLFNTGKPTPEEIKKWVEGDLEEQQMRKVTLGLLIHKDKSIQECLQRNLLASTEFSIEQRPHTSRMQWVKDKLQEIFSFSKKSFREMCLTLSPIYDAPRPLYLGGDAVGGKIGRASCRERV
mgnify:CR=1 FL=1